MTSQRQPPLYDKQDGRCRWCGGKIEIRLKKNGEPAKAQASFHYPDCYEEYRKACNPAMFYTDLVERDGPGCAECGNQKSSLDVDHKIPLWKVRDLPDDQRREYFKIGNLWLLCNDPCHKRKSAKEAAERAKAKRLERIRLEGKKPPRHPMKSRGFDKSLRKKMSREVVPR